MRSANKTAGLAGQIAETALQQAQLKRRSAQADSAAARETFNNWLSTRQATQRAGQDTELVARTQALDTLKDKERAAGVAVEAQQQAALDGRQSVERERRKLGELEQAAQQALNAEYRRVELRVFLYRLALTLPLLVIAGWLFAKKRKTTYWPFVWGFIIFAGFAFFVELVPYLPSYGGYVRYIVGIVVTVLVGRQAILSLNRYLEKQKLAEQLPSAQRRDELSYDTALTRLSKGVCPGCERAVDLKNTAIDFCPHCGIGHHQRIDERFIVLVELQVKRTINVFQMRQRARPDDDRADDRIGQHPGRSELALSQSPAASGLARLSRPRRSRCRACFLFVLPRVRPRSCARCRACVTRMASMRPAAAPTRHAKRH